MATSAKPAGVKEIREYFGAPGVTGNQRDMTLPDMKNEWVKGGLTTEDRAEIAGGIGDGTLTYPDREAPDLEPAA
jgi:hypothetical protein